MRRALAIPLFCMVLGCATEQGAPEAANVVAPEPTSTPGAVRSPRAPSVAPSVSLKYKGSTDYGPHTFDVTFHNPGAQALTVLKPIDGSLWSWHLPYYAFLVRDAKGTELEIMGRCGLSGMHAKDGNWPKTHTITLAPGGRGTLQVSLPYDLTAGQRYDVAFAYAFDPAKREETDRDRANPGAITYPLGTWRGRALWTGEITAATP